MPHKKNCRRSAAQKQVMEREASNGEAFVSEEWERMG